MIVQTKINLPPIRKKLVDRPKLMSKLGAGMRTKVTLVSAQAGYGKTTALTEWAKQCGERVAWVSLDILDNDWHPFWSCMMASIREQVPGFGESIGFLSEQESAMSSESSMTAFLNELQKVNGQLALILDDFHLIDLAAIHQALYYLIQHLPPHIHIYIASRIELPIPTARLLAKGELQLVNMSDLKFDKNEGLAFFRKTTDLQLTNEQAHELFRQTEGWVSGLQLAAISLSQRDDIAVSIRQFNGRQRHISDYLLEEVFRHLPASLRDFMLATSALNRMNGALSGAVTGQPNGQAQLELLERLNLFVIPLDDDRGWYRYHHLLSEFLRRQAAERDQEGWRAVHLHAARWHEEHGFLEEAMEHYIQGEHVADAVRLIESHLVTFMQLNYSSLQRWLSALPENSYADNSLIETFYISMLVAIGRWDEAYRKAKQSEGRFERMRETWPESAWNQAMGDLYYFCGVIAYLRQDLTLASSYFELLDRHLPEGSMFQSMRGMRYEGYDYFHDLLSLTNDLSAVEEFLKKWIDRWKGKDNYPFIGFQYVTYSALLYEWNRLEEAERLVRDALKREDLSSNVWMQVQLKLVRSRLQQAKGHHGHALDVIRQLGASIESPDRGLIERRLGAEQAEIWLRQGSLQQSMDWLKRSGLTHESEAALNRMSEHYAAARVLAVSGRSDEALIVLEKLYGLAQRENRWRDRVKIRIAQSVTGWRSGREEAALEWLTEALELAEPAGYIRSFADEGEMMGLMLSKLLQEHRSDSVSAGYVSRLLETLSVPDADRLSLGITEQETKVLLYLAAHLTNKEIAHELNITPETVKFHVKNIYRKLGIHKRSQVLGRAKELELL